MIFVSNVSTGINSQSSLFLTLQNTFATVESLNNEGLTINVTLDLWQEGNTVLTEVPLIKMPYMNIPVRIGDKIFLTKINHLLNEYFTSGEFTQYIPADSFIAIQCVLQPKFNENEFTNHFTLINPEKTFRWLLNDSESVITAEEIAETRVLKSSTQSYKENVSISIEDSLKMEVSNSIETSCDSSKVTANSEIHKEAPTIDLQASSELKLNSSSIDLGSSGVKLGSLLQQLCDALASSQCVVSSGSSAGSYPSLTNAGQISAIGSQISSVFK